MQLTRYKKGNKRIMDMNHLGVFAKKGVTPVIATTLLIAIVIVLAGIVFVWAQGFIGEAVQKNNEPIDRSCERVSLDVSISRDSSGSFNLDVNNNGNVPLSALKIALNREGKVDILPIDGSSLGVGKSRRFSLQGIYDDSVGGASILPVLRGQRGESLQDYACNERYGIAARIV